MNAAHAEFERAAALTQQKRYPEAYEAFRQAAEAGHGGALTQLGLWELYGFRGAIDRERAREWLGAAEATGWPDAAYHLANLGWCGLVVPRDAAQMCDRLIAAARGDHAPALRTIGLMALRQPATLALAEACLARAASLADPLANYLLALHWSSSPQPQSRQVATGLMSTAARLGVGRAKLRAVAGAQPLRLNAPAVTDFAGFAIDTAVAVAPEVHSREPLVETANRFYSPYECEYLIAYGEPWLGRSNVVGDDGAILKDDRRTSSDATLIGAREDFVVRWLQARMADWLGVPMARTEHQSLLRYLPGQEYRPHYDYLNPGTYGNFPEAGRPGQRIHTIFVFLDGVEGGGETEFPRLGLRIKPARGRLVHFINLDGEGKGDPRTLHSGVSVTAGVKYLATTWTRERDFRQY